jgi:hypothetical protein
MQTLATPLLYRDMEIVGDFLVDHYLGLIMDSHPGLPSVRTLRILRPCPGLDSGTYDRDSQDTVAAIHCLLSAIPRGALTHFEYVGIKH